MSATPDAIDLTTSAPLQSPPRRRVASPAHEGTDGSERRRQKRRRVDPGSDVDQPSSVFTQISTWEIPPEVVANNTPQVSPDPAPADEPIATSSNDTVLPDLRSPTVVTPKADRISSGTPPILTHDEPPSVPEPLSAYTCPICFSPPTNATLTPCGHICCGQCLFTAVKSTIRRNMVVAMGRAPEARSVTPTPHRSLSLIPSRCPVCRAEIPGWDGRGGGVIGLKMQVLYSL